MRLTQRVSLVGSGEQSLATTDPTDSQVYLVRTATGAICVDAGSGGSVDAILKACREDGVDPSSIGWLFLTHAHADHAGGAAAWQERLPEIKVAIAAETADWIGPGMRRRRAWTSLAARGYIHLDTGCDGPGSTGNWKMAISSSLTITSG